MQLTLTTWYVKILYYRSVKKMILKRIEFKFDYIFIILIGGTYMIYTFKNIDEKNRHNELRDLLGCIAKIENREKYGFKNSKAAKHYLANECNISKSMAKRIMIPKWDFLNEELNVNCYYDIDDVELFTRVINFISMKFIEHRINGFTSETDVINYYYGALKGI